MIKLNDLTLIADLKFHSVVRAGKEEFKKFLKDEEGDTNFISIIVLLGIALALAGTFIGFKNNIIDWFKDTIPDFFKIE